MNKAPDGAVLGEISSDDEGNRNPTGALKEKLGNIETQI